MKRRSILPVVAPDLWSLYKKGLGTQWVAEDVDLSADNFDSLDDRTKDYVKSLIFFFANSDAIVNENLALNLLPFMGERNCMEGEFFYCYQLANEAVHSEAYSLLIDSYIKNVEEKEKGFNAMSQIPTVAKKMSWAEKWITNGTPVEQMVAFACVEGLAFSSTFAGIFFLKTFQDIPLKGLFQANEWILRDETLHYEFAVNFYNNHLLYEEKLSSERLKQIILDCYATEVQFIEDIIPNGIRGMKKEAMIQYVQFVADSLLIAFKLDSVFGVSNPFDFMATIGIQRKTNFFESWSASYVNPTDSTLTIIEDF